MEVTILVAIKEIEECAGYTRESLEIAKGRRINIDSTDALESCAEVVNSSTTTVEAQRPATRPTANVEVAKANVTR